MYKLCTTEKSANQQRIFTHTLLRLMGEMSYSEISVTELCQRADLSRKTFYRLFGCKDDVLYALVDSYFHAYSAQPTSEPSIYGHMHRVFSFWKENRDLLDALSKNQQSGLLIERQLAHILREEPQALAEIGAADSPYQQEIMVFFLSALSGLLITWHHDGFRRSVEEMANLCVALLTQPLLRGSTN